MQKLCPHDRVQPGVWPLRRPTQPRRGWMKLHKGEARCLFNRVAPKKNRSPFSGRPVYVLIFHFFLFNLATFLFPLRKLARKLKNVTQLLNKAERQKLFISWTHSRLIRTDPDVRKQDHWFHLSAWSCTVITSCQNLHRVEKSSRDTFELWTYLEMKIKEEKSMLEKQRTLQSAKGVALQGSRDMVKLTAGILIFSGETLLRRLWAMLSEISYRNWVTCSLAW